MMLKNAFSHQVFTPSCVSLWLLVGSSLMAQTRWDAGENRSREAAWNNSNLWQGSDWLGGATAQRSKWYLGIKGENTEVGVLIREVATGSAAARAQLEPGDVVVNVAGYQVGRVESQLYDLTEEINRRADPTGVVSLVVQDNRTARLAQIRLQLDGSQQTLTGSLAFRSRDPLPRDAIVTVQIENVSRPYYQVRHGQQAYRLDSLSEMPFEIAYDPTFINPQDVYQVRAFVTASGRTIMDTPQPQAIITRGNPSQVRLELMALSNSPSSGITGGLVSSSSSVVGSGSMSAGYPNYNQIDEQIKAMYRRYLRRDPSYLELAALRSTPGIMDRLSTMPLDLMAAQEYFDAAGNNNRVWLEAVFQEIVKRPPTQVELDQWMQRYASLGYSRMELLRQLNAQVSR